MSSSPAFLALANWRGLPADHHHDHNIDDDDDDDDEGVHDGLDD